MMIEVHKPPHCNRLDLLLGDILDNVIFYSLRLIHTLRIELGRRKLLEAFWLYHNLTRYQFVTLFLPENYIKSTLLWNTRPPREPLGHQVILFIEHLNLQCLSTEVHYHIAQCVLPFLRWQTGFETYLICDSCSFRDNLETPTFLLIPADFGPPVLTCLHSNSIQNPIP